jgi:hypothetical protein
MLIGQTMSSLLHRCHCPCNIHSPLTTVQPTRRRRQLAAFCSSSQISQIQSDIASGSRSATDVVEQYLTAAEAQEPSLQSFVTLDGAGARSQVSCIWLLDTLVLTH